MDHPDKPRLQRLLDEYFEAMTEEFSAFEGLDANRDLTVDDAILVTVVSMRDPENDQVTEQTVMRCTSIRRYVQSGLLLHGIEQQKKWLFTPDEEENEDED